MNDKIFGLAILFLVGLFFYFCFHIDPDASLISKLIFFPLGLGIFWIIFGYAIFALTVLIPIFINEAYGKNFLGEVMIIQLALSLWVAKTAFACFVSVIEKLLFSIFY
ncbi:hypothetical protein QV08_11895 [Gallibacterium salpingitidis]|uniref:Uncharacterized protein n=1 Tax=Gallibacterium salpingitidis TaxID=505341 RepID=A0AB36E1Y2_9PAST|nr:hypothetical protein [Gallibacterium salpingitidis]OBX05325.1 hypothetical protein QV08_11895 [Gallibacterium salpingitidis]OBX10035.1 hypothetical protein QV09_07000 [Gallibacterium salpingitidis]WKT00590.1 hypothetical protein NYR30_04750 [Gallibacterium salpingitidis]